MAGRWVGLLRSLGEALIDVFRAELSALGEELARLGRRYAAALALVALGVAVGSLTLLAAVFGLIHLLALWMPLWVASFLVAAALAATGLFLALLGKWRFQRLQSPVETVRGRFEEHLDWWEDRVLSERRRDEAQSPEEGDR